MAEKVQGKVAWKFDDNFNADRIVGSKYIGERDQELLGRVCLAEFDPDFVNRVRHGDLVVAGKNFGYGHPHQQGILSLLANGISTLVAESFYPLWYRMAFFHAFPVLICPGIKAGASMGDELEVNFATGVVSNLTQETSIQGEPMPAFLREVVADGGLINNLRKQLKG